MMNEKNSDIRLHSRGQSVFLDDIPVSGDVLQAALLTSPVAHGRIKRLDVSRARQAEGVAAVLTAADIPGENQIGNIIQDEPLLADGEAHFLGQPIALVVAANRRLARKAVQLIELEIDPLPVTTDPRRAYARGQLIVPERTFLLGDPDKAWPDCDIVAEGRADSGGQEHFYLETQAALTLPLEGGGLRVYASTQSPSAVQRITARVLGLPMHQVEVDVRRLGGAFGGKEDQATPWAVLTALACRHLGQPVKLVLRRNEDMRLTGKRHPYSSDFKIGLQADGKILAFEVKMYQNAGAAADLSTAILERSLFHITNAYFIPNVKATAASCRTHLPPFTAFRGFGGPQAMYVIESAIYLAARKMGIDPWQIQKQNLLAEGDTLPYGMQVQNGRARQCWQKAEDKYKFQDIESGVRAFNEENKMVKRGVSVMPVCFGISFTNKILNQAGALVHVYVDGSVSVSTGAVEMGQGVNQKILQVAAHTLSIDPARLRIETTNTTRVANTSPTAASTGADLNARAAQFACQAILERLQETAAEALSHPHPADIEIRDEAVYCEGKVTPLTWEGLVNRAYLSRVNLSAQAHYATPDIYFDRVQEKGKPFAYHVFGTAVTEVTLDCLRGTYEVDAVHIVHDVGRSLNLLVDRGQVEGGLVQGIGWMTIEELLYDREGRLLTDTTSTYKVPDIKSTPKTINLHFLEQADNPYAVMKSKAVGEPPFMYGIGAYFALMNAVRAFRPQAEPIFDAPLTPEKILKYLYHP
jgi:xanthine dehydrogenase large subunit